MGPSACSQARTCPASLDLVSCCGGPLGSGSVSFQVCLKRKTRTPGSRTTEPCSRRAQQSPSSAGGRRGATLARGPASVRSSPLSAFSHRRPEARRGPFCSRCSFQEAEPVPHRPAPPGAPCRRRSTPLAPASIPPLSPQRAPAVPVPTSGLHAAGATGPIAAAPVARPAALCRAWQPPGSPGARTRGRTSCPRCSERHRSALRLALGLLCFLLFRFK